MDAQGLYEKAVRLLSYREHAERELRQKLMADVEAPSDLEAVLERLKASDYLSDDRFASAYLRSRAGKGYGPQRIRQELQEKGVARATIDSAFDSEAIDWAQLAQRVWEKRFGVAPATAKEHAKQQRYMIYRGFNLKKRQSIHESERD